MSLADGKHAGNPEDAAFNSHPRFKNGLGLFSALAANLTLTAQHRRRLRIVASVAHRDVILPPEATSNGLEFEIANWSATALNLVVKDDGGSTIATLNQNEAGTFVCDGTSWYLFPGIVTIAQS